MISITTGTDGHGERDEAGKPEKCGEEEQDEGHDRMAEAGEAEGREEVGQEKQGP